MSVKKILPLFILLLLMSGNRFEISLASNPQEASTKNFLQSTETITVCAGPSCDYNNIQDAIDNASSNDVIELSSETYQELITITEDVFIIGDGWENTIIQAASDQGIATNRVITVTNGVSVTLSGVTIRYGKANGSGLDGYGGGILNQGNIIVQNCLVTLNTSDNGGGIANKFQSGEANATISNSTIQDNDASTEGAGILNEALGEGTTSILTITHSTISTNSAEIGGGVANIANQEGTASFISLNSTISKNNADINGGGLFNQMANGGSGGATINQSTLNNNSGGNIYNDYSVIDIAQSVVANAPPGNSDCENNGGTINNAGFNLVQDGTCGFPIGGDPKLGILADYGGDTMTHSLEPGSPALDAIPPVHCSSSSDQRSYLRPFGAGCDIGAFELDTINVDVDYAVNEQYVIPGQIITFTTRINPIGPGISGGIITATVPAELNIQWPIQLDPSDAGTIGETPVLAHSIIITANHSLTMTMAAEVSLGIPGGTQFDNIISFFSTEIITPVVKTKTIYVNNASPIALNDEGDLFTTTPDTIFITGNVLDNDSDPNGDPLIIFELITSSLKGSLTPLGDGTFSYDPDGQFNDLPPGQTGEDTFRYKISDGQGGDDEAIVTITIYQDASFIYLPLIMK